MPGGYSERTAPDSAISSNSFALNFGYATSTPQPSTATVRPARKAPLCAAESIPCAAPLTTVTPCAATPIAISSATRFPYWVAARAPTIAIRSVPGIGFPRANRTNGGRAISRRIGGYSSSSRTRTRMRFFVHASAISSGKPGFSRRRASNACAAFSFRNFCSDPASAPHASRAPPAAFAKRSAPGMPTPDAESIAAK